MNPAPVGAGRLPSVMIDRAALAHNWRLLACHAPGARTGAAVKADGYGLGAAEVARTLHAEGCRDFFVAWAEEGAALRQTVPAAGCRIFVLQGLDPAAARLCRNHDLVPVLSTPEELAAWQGSGTAERRPAAIQLETGMNRLGLDEGGARAAAALFRDGELNLCLVMSHLASADDPQSPQNRAQLARFSTLCSLFPGVPRSLANSAGVYLGPEYHFELTRPGIALYGGGCGPAASALLPVVTLSASILQIRTARSGEAVGYGAAARLRRDSRVATVGIGYADGYPRSASGDGISARPALPGPEAFVAGRRVPVLGRVSMDMTALDLTDIPEDAVRPGDRAEFFGPHVSIDGVARSAGTISYELLTSLGPRVRRVWA